MGAGGGVGLAGPGWGPQARKVKSDASTTLCTDQSVTGLERFVRSEEPATGRHPDRGDVFATSSQFLTDSVGHELTAECRGNRCYGALGFRGHGW